MTTDNTLKFSLVRYQPDSARQEVVNVGTALFTAAGPRVTIAGNLTKLLSIDPNLSLLRVQDEATTLAAAMHALWQSGTPPDAMAQLLGRAMAGLTLSAPGLIDTEGRPIEEVIAELQRDLVLAPVKKGARTPRSSRLHDELRAVFKNANMLGKSPGDISEHLVVTNYPIDPDVGLFAEFALRNGRLHVTETVDFRTGGHSSKKREAESKTLVLLQALATVGRADLVRHVVVGGASASTQASINLLSRYADDLVVRESNEDWNRYVKAMAHAAKKPELATQ